MVRVEVTICNELGLHARAAGKLVQAATGFASEVWLIKDNMRVNGKSIMGILTLAAAKGQKLVIEIDGPDKDRAADELRKLIQSGFGENNQD